jgi:hypothetical protein
VNRGDKRTRRVRDRDFVKFERFPRYRDRYRCQEKKSRRGRAPDQVFRDPPHATNETSIAVRGSRLPPPCSVFSARIYRKNELNKLPKLFLFNLL